GGPGALVSWTSLGQQGRSFTGTGPSVAELEAFRGAPARIPVRAYAGLESAGSAEQLALLAVDDLARAGGFERGTLVVATATGSGWVDPGAVDSVEYMTGGHPATVAVEDSLLPDSVSY